MMRVRPWVIAAFVGLCWAAISASPSDSIGTGPTVVHAQQAPVTFRVRAVDTGSPNSACNPGGLVVMRISVESIQGLSALSFKLHFNQNVATIAADGVSAGTDIPSGWLFAPNSNTPGQLIIGLIGTTPSADSFTIADVTFVCGGSQGLGTGLTFSNLLAATFDEVVLQTGSVNGSITIAEPSATTVDPVQEQQVDLADLSISTISNPNPVVDGSTLVYTITINNNGPGEATNVTMTDMLPASVNFESAATSQGACSESGSTVVCDIGSLDSGAAVTATIQVTLNLGAAGVITNTARVVGGQTTPGGNGTATETTTVLFVEVVGAGTGGGTGGGGGGGVVADPSPVAPTLEPPLSTPSPTLAPAVSTPTLVTGGTAIATPIPGPSATIHTPTPGPAAPTPRPTTAATAIPAPTAASSIVGVETPAPPAAPVAQEPPPGSSFPLGVIIVIVVAAAVALIAGGVFLRRRKAAF